MLGSRRSFPFVLVAISLATMSCGGGGGGGGGIQPPPPQPDFAISVSASPIDISQGNVSPPINISISPRDGFSLPVSITFSGLPSGITSNPSAPFSVNAGASVSVLFDALSDAAAGQFTVTAQGTSGSLSHSSAFTLDIHQTVPVNLPRTTFVPNDSVASLDNPAGEPRRRHMVYDAASQRLYVANCAMNRVEVWTGANPSLLATIDVPRASSADLSPDAKTLWVGSATEQVFSIDAVSLRVNARYPSRGLSPVPGLVFDRPIEVLSLATGKFAVRLRQSNTSEALLALWDPASNSFTNLTSLAPAVFQNGVGVLARSADRTHLLIASNDPTGELAIFDSNGNLIATPQAPVAGTILLAAANTDGSRFAVVVASGASSQLLLLDSRLTFLTSYSTHLPAGLVFSTDGQTLYLDEPFGNSNVVTALNASTLQPAAQIADIPIDGVPTNIEAICAAPFLCGLGNRGISFLDSSQTASLSPDGPIFSPAPAAQPADGSIAGGTSVTVTGENLSSAAQVRFGTNNPIGVSSASDSQMQVASPPGAVVGPTNLTAYFSNGWLALAPSAFSYGPTILRVFPNAGSSSGGDMVTILGYGFGTSSGNLSVTIAGQTASIVSADQLPAFRTALGLDSTFPFPLERVVIKTPSGPPGKTDLVLHSAAGSNTSPKAFQFLASTHVYPNPGLHKFITYDSSRQKLFLSSTDQVDVFDLNAHAFVSPLFPPPNGPPPSAALRGLALTPDHSQLFVADFGAQDVYLIDPDGIAYNGTAVRIGGVAGFLNSGPARVSATSAQTVFVGLSGEGNSSGSCGNCLGQMNLLASPPIFAPAPQPEVTSLTGAPLLQADAAGDTAYLAYGTPPGGPVASWSASSPNAFALSSAAGVATDLSTAADGSLFAVRSHNTNEIRGPDLTLSSVSASAELESIPNRVAVPGLVLHPSGALLYEPFLDGSPPSAPPAIGIHGGIDIRDAHNGQLRLRVYLPEPFAMLDTDVDGLHGGFLTTDENGQRLFVLTTSGLSIIQLANVPLGIGSLSPSAGSAAGGVVVTLRGSGFVSGIKVTLGGKSANITWKDMNTLTFATPALSPGLQTLTLTNPDGESASLDAAFQAQ